MGRILLEPRQVENARHLVACAKQRSVASAVAVLLWVELLEVCADVFGLADEDADGEERVRDRKRGSRLSRTLSQHEPGQVGAGLGRDRDVFLAGEAADLHERTAQEVGELRAGIGGAHQRRADEDRVGAGELRGRGLRAVGDAALGDDRAVARRARDQVELHGAVDLERAQVARVHADD